MKTLIISAVLLLSMAQIGSSTLCYTCTMSLTDQSCMEVANCTGTTPYCGTSRINGFIMTYISKFCSAACISATQNFTHVSATESCCSSDLCNTEQIGNVNSAFLGSGSGGLSGSALLLVTIGSLLNAIFAI
ncbi:prostate stem cell antigen-like [Hyla sarda]|uniref:prostate stem cell antigen-like n=1 Tax=Hyla sarda TaxID=327740 RepID=UPI0024C2A7C4|nr:prostate stem cell antigen-like [Hyla sarda]